jgi:hypothetical protein
MSYIPSTSSFIGASTREVHVGNVPNAYPTMEAALAAVAALSPPPSSTLPVAIIVHAGTYSPASAAWQIPSYVSVVGVSGSTTTFLSATYDLFSVQGDSVFFGNFHISGQNNPALAAFRLNGHSYVNIDNVGMWNGGSSSQKFVAQTGSTWTQHSITNCFYDSGVTTSYVCEFLNTSGSPRFCDVEIDAMFGDTWSAGASGGGFYLSNVQDVRFKNSKIRTAAGSTGIRLVVSGSWVEIDTVTSVLQGGSYGNLFNGDAGTLARMAYCDGTTGGSATIVVVGGLTGPQGIQGNPGVPGPAGPSSGLTTAYDLDLSTLTPATYNTDGIKTIDGRAAWRLFNSNHGQLIALNDGTHAGLYTRDSTYPASNYGTGYDGPRWTVGLFDVAGLSPRYPIEQWVWYMFSQPHVPNANYEFAYFGISLLPGADVDTGHNVPVIESARGYSTGLTTITEWQKTSTVVSNPSGVTPPLTTDDVYVFRILPGGSIEIYSGASVAGAWPTIGSLSYCGQVHYFNPVQGFASEAQALNAAWQWAAVFSCASSNAAGNSDMLLKKFKAAYR